MMSHIGTACVPLSPSADGTGMLSPGEDIGTRTASMNAKCSYSTERWAVLSQIGIIVGHAWLSAKWACGDGPLPMAGDLDFHIEQLQQVCAWRLPELIPHAHEWTGQPVWVYYPDGLCRIP